MRTRKSFFVLFVFACTTLFSFSLFLAGMASGIRQISRRGFLFLLWFSRITRI